MEYKNLLVLTDFSEDAEHAVRTSVEFAKRYEASITLLHVIHDSTNLSFILSDDEYRSVDNKMEKHVERAFKALFEKVPELNSVPCKTKIRRGTPYINCLYELEKGDYDIVFAGSHGESRVKHVLMGSTSEKVLRNSPVDVFVTKR
ncbi:universal stress protein [Oceanidesulfovibrio marinus]|uniref:Universal stress protein n=1 Tax=Oceanidesulfovibrio marinus TaxID=370038 RepID=A0ABX6NJS2_9BACT|nr:universal stress protein [Oceanidesulfovibrio marinus]QJT09972.1 universal stress protein [Oceanidesulfovibrio marinus]